MFPFTWRKEYDNRAEEVFTGWIWKRHLFTFHWLGINFMATLGNSQIPGEYLLEARSVGRVKPKLAWTLKDLLV